jgi:hypothetical protein
VKTFVLFIQGGGEGAYEADAVLAKSLQRALGDEYDVRYPQMPDESNPDMQTWKTKILKRVRGSERQGHAGWALDGWRHAVENICRKKTLRNRLPVCSCSLCRRGMKKTGISRL